MSELGLGAAGSDPRHLALRALLEYQLGHAAEGAAHIARLHEVAASVPPRADRRSRFLRPRHAARGAASPAAPNARPLQRRSQEALSPCRG